MSDIKEIMSLSVQTLAGKQHDVLKKHVLKILSDVKLVIEQEKYDSVANFTASSPSGDGYGCDNDYIDFGYEPDYSLDIIEVVAILSRLKDSAK